MLLSLLLPLLAQALDTTALYEERQREIAKIDFFCPIGRQPIHNSIEALGISPGPACKFSGPLDTKRDPLLLEAPFLNPHFTFENLRALLLTEGISLGSDGRFSVGGESFRAQTIDASKMKDVLFHLHGYPQSWGRNFLSLSLTRKSAVDAFVALAQRHPGFSAFWSNPYYSEETRALPRLQGVRKHMPLPLLSKCHELPPLPRLLFVGDMHNAPDSVYFLSVVEKHDFSFAALEVNRDKQPFLDAFLRAVDPTEEAQALTVLTDRFPKEMMAPFQAIYRTLKAKRVPIILMDYEQAYFNFPYTNTAFHGLPIAMRNQLWTDSLPTSWNGTGVMFAGRDHFLDLPSADLQDFMNARFPGVDMALINPMEKCE